MKQKVSPPVAIAIAAVVLLVIFGALYKTYMVQPSISPEDVRARFGHAKSGPPNRGTQGATTPAPAGGQ